MTDSIDTSERESEDPRQPIRLPVFEMRDEPQPDAVEGNDLPDPIMPVEVYQALRGMMLDYARTAIALDRKRRGVGEPVAWTVAGEVKNWSRDFSKYRTQHYIRPVYLHPPIQSTQQAEPVDVPDRMKQWVKLHNIQPNEFVAFHIGFCCGEQAVIPFEPTEAMERAFNKICPVGEDFGDAWAAAHAVARNALAIHQPPASEQGEAPSIEAPRNIIWDSRRPDYPVEWSNPGRAAREGEVHYIRYDLYSDAVYAATTGRSADQPAASAGAGEQKLRRMLCVAYAGGWAYMDDGEAQDNRAHPCIDFLRDSPDLIEQKMRERNRAALSTQHKDQP